MKKINSIMFFGILSMIVMAFAWRSPNAESVPRLPPFYNYPLEAEVLVIVDTPQIILPTSTIDSYRRYQTVIIKNIEKAKKDNKQISKSIDQNLENLDTIHKYVAKKDSSQVDSLVVLESDSLYTPSKHGWIYKIFHK